MSNLRKKMVMNLKYGGITKEEYEELQDEILEKDRSSLQMTAICLVFMFTGLFLGSLVNNLMASNRIAYAMLWLCFVILYLITKNLKKKSKWLVLPLWYGAMTYMFVYAAVLNTIVRNDISATTFCIIMIVAPLLILDRPWHVFSYFTLVVLLFIPMAFHFKSSYLAFTDMVNILCCLFLGTVIHFGIIRTKLREMMQRRYIEKQRDTDNLTGCLTKAAFENQMKQCLKEDENAGVLLVMDVDKFKSINDNYGHTFGDLVLHTFGQNLAGTFPQSSLCGRFGGDEFVVWMPGILTKKEITEHLDELMDRIHSIKTPDGKIVITSSIGIAECPENGKTYQELFENADAALYTAKNLGRNRYVFCPDMGKGI